jgi:Pvc16 N-terminal domain/Carboxypeptidase regulatory-like domain
MLEDLDSSLAALFDDAAAPEALRSADVAFDTPDKDYRPTQPTLNLFLHEVTENRTLRDEARVVTPSVSTRADRRPGAGDKYSSRLPSMRLDCTYLVTAWSIQAAGLKAAEEHRLLGLALRWLGCFPVLDEKFLRGSLSSPPQPYPLPTVLARTQEGRSNGEFWTALGIVPRLAFSLTVTITVDPYDEVEEFTAVQDVRIRPASISDPALSGFVLDHVLAPVPGAIVTVLETGARTTSGPDGGFAVSGLDFGNYTLQVQQGARPPEQVPVTYQADHQIHTLVLTG